jgi:predicted SprT family Zn-dependent metalloprotease
MASLIQTQLEANALLRQHGLYAQGWRFIWDNAKTRGGQCKHRERTISMSKYLVPLWSEDQVTQTLIHEVAHAVVGPGNGHGRVWQAQMRAMGVRADRCHSNETVQGRYLAICDHCGVDAHRAHRMSPAMKQGRHLHAACRKSVRWVDTATLVR